MLRAGQLEKQAIATRLLLRARLVLLALWGEIAVGSVSLARLGFITVALGLQTAVLVSPAHFRPAPDWEYAVLAPLLTLGSLAACLAAGLPLGRLLGVRTRQGLAVLALAGLGALAATGASYAATGVSFVADGKPYTNDGAAMDLYAANQVLHGRNPYIKTSIVAALASIDAPGITVTPLMDGQFRVQTAYPSDDVINQVFLNVLRHQPRTIPPEFESKYNYPAGSFLFILPFVWVGLHDMRLLYALAIVGMGLYVSRQAPRALRPLVPLIVLGNVSLMALTAGGQPDPIYGLFLMLGYAAWRRPWLSPLCMGLALGTKQLSWFFVPFYLLLIVRELGWRDSARRAALMAGVFLLLNGPFIAQSPDAYFASIAGPMSDPMFPLGVGIVAVFVANVAPMVSKLVFTVGELVSWFSSSVAAWRWSWITPTTGIVLGALPLFFAWRSLVNYFYLIPILTLAAAFAADRARVEA